LSKTSYDLIHCHHALSAVVLFLSVYNKRNVIVSFQNDPENELGSFVFKLLYKKCTARIFKNNSGFITDDFSFYFPNGVNTSFFKPIKKSLAKEKLGLDQNKKYLLFVSSNFLRRQKRYDIFTKTLEILHKQYNNNDIEELCLINIEREKVPLYFNASDIHLLTSDFEGSPNSVKESLACNTPVVSTNVGNVSEMLNGVSDCFVSKCNNPEELAEYCNRILTSNNNDIDLRSSLFKKGYDIETKAIELIEIYSKVLKKSK